MKAISVLLLVGSGLIVLYFSWMEWQYGARAEKWTAVPAHIDNLDVVNEYSDKAGHPQWQLVITYSYKVDGVTFHSNFIQFGGNSRPSGGSKEECLARYKERDIVAYYDPQNHGSACMYKDMNTANLRSFTVVGLFLVMVGIILLIFGKNTGIQKTDELRPQNQGLKAWARAKSKRPS